MDFRLDGAKIQFVEAFGRELAEIARAVPELVKGAEERFVQPIRNESKLISGLKITDSRDFAGGAYGNATRETKDFTFGELRKYSEFDINSLKVSLGYQI